MEHVDDWSAKDIYEAWEEEFKEDIEEHWKHILVKVQDYATKRRLEANLMKRRRPNGHYRS